MTSRALGPNTSSSLSSYHGYESKSGRNGPDNMPIGDDMGLSRQDLIELGLSPREFASSTNSAQADAQSSDRVRFDTGGYGDGSSGGGYGEGGDSPDGSNDRDGLQSDEDVRLWVQNQRFQAAVMQAMEKTVGVLQDKLMEKVASLSASEKSREDLAVGLHDMRTELQRIMKSLHKSRKDFEEAVSSRKIALNELSSSRREVAQLRKEITESQQASTKLKREHSQALDQLQTVRTLSSVVECDLKVSAQTNTSLQSELERAQKQLKTAENSIADLRAQLQVAQDERHQANEHVKEERSAVVRERAIVERLEADLKVTRAANDAISKQWQMALNAMEKRDATVLRLSEQHSSATEELKSAQSEAQAHAKAAEEFKERANEFQAAQEKERMRVAHLHTQAKSTAEERDALLKEVKLIRSQLDATNAVLLSKEKVEHGQKEHIELLKQKVMSLQSEMDDIKNKLHETRAQLSKSTVVSGQTEEKLRSEFESELESTRQSLITSENDRHLAKIRLVQLEEELKRTRRDNESLDTEYKQTSNRYDQVQKEVKALEDELERASYRANKHLHESQEAQRRAEAEKSAVATAAEVEIASLKAKLKDKQKQVDEVSKAFLATQQKVLSAYNKEKNVYESASSLKSQLATAETVRDKFKTDLQDLQGQFSEAVLESNEDKLTLKRTQDKLAAAQDRVRDLERRLDDAMFLERTKQAHYEEELSGLKAQLARHQNESRDWVGLIQTLQREKNLLESRCELYKHRVAGMEKQVSELSNKVHEAKQKHRQTVKENSVADRQFGAWSRQFETVFQKELQKRSNGVIKNMSAPSSTWSYSKNLNHSKSQASLTRVDSAVALDQAVDESVSDSYSESSSQTSSQNMLFIKELVSRLRSELQRVSALNAERMAEIVRLRQQLNAIALSDDELKDRENAYVGKVKELVLQRRTLQSDLVRLQRRCLRAETVATSLEHQLRVSLVNLKKAQLGQSINSLEVHNNEVSGGGGADSSVLLLDSESTTTHIALAASGKPEDAQKLQELTLWEDALKELHTLLLTVPNDVKPSIMLKRFIEGDIDTAAAEAAVSATVNEALSKSSRFDNIYNNQSSSHGAGAIFGSNSKGTGIGDTLHMNHRASDSAPGNNSNITLQKSSSTVNLSVPVQDTSSWPAQIHTSASMARLSQADFVAQSGAILAINAINSGNHATQAPTLFALGSAPVQRPLKVPSGPQSARNLPSDSIRNSGGVGGSVGALKGSPSLIDLIKAGKVPPGWAPAPNFYGVSPRSLQGEGTTQQVNPTLQPQAQSPLLSARKATPLKSIGSQVVTSGSRPRL